MYFFFFLDPIVQKVNYRVQLLRVKFYAYLACLVYSVLISLLQSVGEPQPHGWCPLGLALGCDWASQGFGNLVC